VSRFRAFQDLIRPQKDANRDTPSRQGRSPKGFKPAKFQNPVFDLGKANDSSKFDSLKIRVGLDRRADPDWLRSWR
jgi:hypothetical protein